MAARTGDRITQIEVSRAPTAATLEPRAGGAGQILVPHDWNAGFIDPEIGSAGGDLVAPVSHLKACKGPVNQRTAMMQRPYTDAGVRLNEAIARNAGKLAFVETKRTRH